MEEAVSGSQFLRFQLSTLYSNQRGFYIIMSNFLIEKEEQNDFYQNLVSGILKQEAALSINLSFII